MNELVDLGALHPSLARLERPVGGPGSGLNRALSERLGIDPLLIRVMFILLTWLGGVGIVVYAWGTLLTPRAGGQPPLLRLAPAFVHWAPRTQWTVVAGSSIVVVAAFSPVLSFSAVPVLVAVLLVLLLRRQGRLGTPNPAPTHPVSPTDPQEPAELPVVDLYAPEEPIEFPAPQPPSPQRRSWWGGLVVMGVGAVTAGLVLIMRPTNDLLLAAAMVLAAIGLTILGWSLLARARGLPITVLIAACLLAMMTGALATARVTGNPSQDGAVDSLNYSFVASDTTIDLQHLPVDRSVQVQISATASHVTVLLPTAPNSYDTSLWLSEVILPTGGTISSRSQPESVGIHMILRGSLSEIEVEYPR
ncbi:MAG: hypothetical protein Q4D79_07600 [Propionibacteriaceae bacterium]|nr:hypothetical protein [Propionibacteriaceae bacterium]